MNRDPATLVLAVSDTINRVRNGESPYASGPLCESDMIRAALRFSSEVDHGVFYAGVEERFTRGEDPASFITEYLGIVFAQGFAAGTRFGEEKRNHG